MERPMKPMSRPALLVIGTLVAACAGKAASGDGSPPPAVPSASETGTAEPGTAEASEERIAALSARIVEGYRNRDWRACADGYTEVAELKELEWIELYNGACCFALAGDTDEALTWLERAVPLGMRNVKDLERDGDLTTLHEDPRWAALMVKVQANLDAFLATLNRELYELYQADQGDRHAEGDIDWAAVGERDRQRQERVLAIVAAGEARAADDWYHAAMVMQHGDTLDHYQNAHEWAMKAVELDSDHPKARWLAAAAKDRWLMHQGKPQWYGTQFVKEGDTWVLYEVDPDEVTDEERARWNVPPLAQARERAKAMNASGH
jgi:tetratricopeptide (TPR) repeat protein